MNHAAITQLLAEHHPDGLRRQEAAHRRLSDQSIQGARPTRLLDSRLAPATTRPAWTA